MRVEEVRLSRDRGRCGPGASGRCRWRANSAHGYALAAAANLPYADGSFDLVVAYNMLMDVNDVPAAVKEMRRVLGPDGQLLISIVHPLADHGKFLRHEPDSPLVVKGTYFGRQRFE